MKKISLNRNKKIIAVVAIAVVCVGGAVGYKTVSNNARNEQMQKHSQIETYYVPDAEKIFVSGKLVPNQSKDFSIDPEQGVLNELKVEDGAIVEKDTLLYSCKNTQTSKEVEGLEDEIATKTKEKQNAVDEEMKKSIDLEISVMKDKVKKLKDKIYSYVYAPFSGKVYINKANNEGQNNSIMTLETTDFYVDGKVNEYDSFKISVGQEIEVLLHSTKEKVSGKITAISDKPYGDGNSQDGAAQTLSEYGVKIEVPQKENFKNGLHVQGIAKHSETNLKIPVNSIIEDGDKSYVYKVENDIARKTEISVLEKTPDYIIVSAGINQGDILLKNANTANIEDGQSIYGNGSTQGLGGK